MWSKMVCFFCFYHLQYVVIMVYGSDFLNEIRVASKSIDLLYAVSLICGSMDAGKHPLHSPSHIIYWGILSSSLVLINSFSNSLPSFTVIYFTSFTVICIQDFSLQQVSLSSSHFLLSLFLSWSLSSFLLHCHLCFYHSLLWSVHFLISHPVLFSFLSSLSPAQFDQPLMCHF